MSLLIFELQPLDAVLGWPDELSPWADDPDEEIRRELDARELAFEASDTVEPLPTDGLPAWYQPRISALRWAIVGG